MKTIHHAQQEVATVRQEVNAWNVQMEQKIEAHLCEVKTELTAIRAAIPGGQGNGSKSET